MDPVVFETTTSRLQGGCSAKLSYEPMLVALSGLEPEFPTWKAGELNQLFDSAEI